MHSFAEIQKWQKKVRMNRSGCWRLFATPWYPCWRMHTNLLECPAHLGSFVPKLKAFSVGCRQRTNLEQIAAERWWISAWVTHKECKEHPFGEDCTEGCSKWLDFFSPLNQNGNNVWVLLLLGPSDSGESRGIGFSAHYPRLLLFHGDQCIIS